MYVIFFLSPTKILRFYATTEMYVALIFHCYAEKWHFVEERRAEEKTYFHWTHTHTYAVKLLWQTTIIRGVNAAPAQKFYMNHFFDTIQQR